MSASIAGTIETPSLRERIVSLGRRDARGRIAYLLCEMLWRHASIGLSEQDIFHLPLTQTELGDALGLTPVHVNRVLKEFRLRHLVAMEHRMLSVLGLGALLVVASYLYQRMAAQRPGNESASP